MRVTKSQPTDRIAVVGMAGLFPGSPDLERFWHTIAGAVDATTDPPTGRWLLAPSDAYDARVGAPDKVCATRGGFVAPVLIEPGGLDLEASALQNLDPLFHLALHVARQAWSDARTEGLDRGRVGVILGNLILPTETTSLLSRQVLGRTFAEQLGVAPDDETPREPWNAIPAGLPAGLIAQDLGLGGGTYTLDAACASSLYAVKLAADELLAGRADVMLTGGISRPDPLYTQMGFSQLRALAPGGRPRPFDAQGDGLIVGEGAGIFVLKRLSDALRDGDTIHGVIAGAGLSNDLDGGLLAPSSEGQLRAMHAAYEQSGWDPRDVELIECHATGTPVGDAVELASLRTLWGSDGWQPGQCVIGSVKSNIGHALTAAGAAGLLKVLLAMRHKMLPPTANFEQPCASLESEPSPFSVLTEAKPWEACPERPRRAAVSGFGFGGINAHLLIEEWDPTRAATAPATERADEVPIAIVGMSAQLGPFAGLRAVQERALGGGEPAEASEPRNWWGIDRARWFEAAAERPRGFYVDEITLPLDRFRIPPKELEEMLPQQSLMLRVASEAIADAGWDERPRARAGTLIGIGLDLNTTNFHLRWWVRKRAPDWNRELGLNLAGDALDAWTDSLCDALGPPLTANRTMGALGGLIASRIAREFRIGGPSFTVSSDETSGTRALAIAARMLGTGELDEAVVGAVDLPGDPRMALSLQDLAARQPAGGESPRLGEGAVAFVLKRLEDAERDGDRIYAVLAGFGEGAGGAAQTLESASVNTAALGYLDVDDPRTIPAAVLPPQRACALASAQGDFGRPGAAAGIAAVAKAALCLYQQVLPPWRPAHLPTAAAYVPRDPQYWLRDRVDGPRHALVSAHSLDGNRHHIVLSEFDSSEGASTIERIQPLGARQAALFAVEADDRIELAELLRSLESLVTQRVDAPIEALARQWWSIRPNDSRRRFAVAFAAENAASLLTQLSNARALATEGRTAAPGTTTRGPYFSPSLFPAGQVREALGSAQRIALVYPGLGSLHAGMGRTLSVQWPEVLRRQDQENARLRSQLAPGAFWSAELPASFSDHCAPILGQVSVGSFVTDLLQTFGIHPGATIGYSLGETAALVSTRAWTQRDEMLRRLYASPLFRTDLAGPCEAAARAWGLPVGQSVEWLAGLVPCSAATVDAALEGRKRVYRLIVNAPSECVIGGERAAVLRLVDDLGCRLFPLPLVSTVHCEIARVVAREYRELHLLETNAPADVRVYSGAWGRAYRPDQTTAANAILAHATEGIDFPAVIERAYADGLRVFVEVGPGASCSRLIDAILGDRPHLARSACPGGQDEVVALFDLLARLIAERLPVDLSAHYGRATRVEAHQAAPETPARRVLTVAVGGRPMTVPPLPAPARTPEEPRNVEPSAPPVAIPPTRTETPVSAPPVRLAEPTLDPSGLQHAILASTSAKTDAQGVYLNVAGRIAQSMANQLSFQMALVDALMTDAPATPAWDRMPRFTTAPPPALDRDQCLEFAVGSIGAVLGPEFAEVDTFPTRVRLPDEPLMLVDRIVSIEGEARSMTHGRVVTEHDVLPDGWYLDGGRIPPCIAIEAGQADLFLSGYLGIDFITRGLAVYRLLDAAVTFHQGLPGPGSVIRYDIHIDHFFRQGDTHLFRFRFEAEVDGQPLMSMRDGCAGFFSEAELSAGKGIVAASLDRRPQRGTLPADWTPLVDTGHESYTDAQVDALRRGDLAGAFGQLFEGLPLRAPATLPGGRMTLVHRVLSLDPNGGRYGLGLIRAEADIHPGDWFIVCHFVDDRVMPGTLMYECCLHTLRVYLTRLGWVGEADEVAWEPLPGVATRLRCRGQVTESTRKVVYEIAIKELGYGPEPFAIVDALMYADDRPVVEIANMSLRLTGQTRDRLERLWAGRASGPRRPLYTREQILAFAIGKPSEAFGPAFRVFDERFIARLPGPPYAFLDRVTALSAEPLRMIAGGTVETEYDIPPDEWYFAADRQPRMPFAVLLEIALQPCGWMAAYMGSALTSDDPLHFRNLGGTAVLQAPVTPASGTLTVAVKVTKVAHSAGMIIQHFDFEVRDRNGSVYRGDTYFGFFRPEALANQVGIRDATPYAISAAEQARARAFAYPVGAPFPDDQWRMIERVDAFVSDGGPAGLGFIEGSKQVNPDDWFFKAHFYQDPVVPGSLGLESFLQLLKVVANERWGVTPDTVFETPVLGATHRWIYRGQVIPTCEWVKVQAVVTHVDDARRLLRADGYLSVDGRVIYQMNDFTMALG